MLAWLSANWRDALSAAAEVVAASSVIVLAFARFTDTDKDDKAGTWLGKAAAWMKGALGSLAASRVVNTLALNPKKTLKK